jgi:hypothetical protein
MSISTERQTLADYVAIAISPALIVALVGSLVFFLVEVLLGPNYPGQLLWILFFAVFGAVLVSRISMSTDIADRAGMYGLILGVLVWIALKVYVKYPPESQLAALDWFVNMVLIVITWWSAHRLTRDSTLIDDNVDASGAGLLQVAGLENNPANEQDRIDEERKERKRDPAGLDGWFARFRRYRAQVNKRPHAPGVWVVYFSLAALPLFGVGQSLIPSADVERRRYVFWLMGVYVASGLGLLLTTSFLNLRRYLRQRNLHMPIPMTGVWLTGGLLIIVALLSLGALIPRPSPEYALVDLGALVGAKEQEGSRNAQGKGWATEKGDAAEGAKQAGSEKSGKSEGKGTANDKAKETGKAKKGKSGSGGKGQGEGRGKGKGEGDNKQPNEDQQERDAAEEQPEPTSNPLPEVGKFLVTLLKWIVIGAVVLVIAFFLGRALLRFLANFTHWAKRILDTFQNFWNRLLNWWQGELPMAVLDTPEAAEPPRPFATFQDPFATGQAQQMTPAELVRYSYDALEAWAHDRDLARQCGETPLEFVERLTMDFPGLDRAGPDLASLYVGLAYARKTPRPEQVEPLRQFWRLLVDMVERPMSAAAAN